MLRLRIVNLRNILRAFTWNYRDKEIAKGIKRLSKGIFVNVHADVPKKTRRLERSLREAKVSSLEYHHTEGIWYGKLVRSGSPPHTIYPRRPKYALYWKELPHPIPYVRRHPGFKKIEYNVKAVNRSQGLIDQTAIDIGETVTVRLSSI